MAKATGFIEKKVGIVGGTFNPIHAGHLIMGEQAYSEFGLDEILFVPTGISYLKDPAIVLDKRTRYNMTKEAIADNDHFKVSRIEVERDGYSYTYETLEQLRSEHPHNEYYFIVGADTLFMLENWKEPQIILKDAVILACCRDDQDEEAILQKSKKLMQKYEGADIRILHSPQIQISSTDIRARVKEGKSIKYLVTPRTESYIKDHNLYKD